MKIFQNFFSYEIKKRIILLVHGLVLKIQSKTLLNMKMLVKYLNFVFHIEVKTKSNYKILNFFFQFMKKKKRNGTLGTQIFSISLKNFRLLMPEINSITIRLKFVNNA